MWQQFQSCHSGSQQQLWLLQGLYHPGAVSEAAPALCLTACTPKSKCTPCTQHQIPEQRAFIDHSEFPKSLACTDVRLQRRQETHNVTTIRAAWNDQADGEVHLYRASCQVKAAGSPECAVTTLAQSFSRAGAAAMSTTTGSFSSSSATFSFRDRFLVFICRCETSTSCENPITTITGGHAITRKPECRCGYGQRAGPKTLQRREDHRRRATPG